MNLRRLSVISAQVGLIFLAGTPSKAADAQFRPDSDILGLRLAMTHDEALKLVKQDYPDAAINYIPAILGTRDFQKKAIIGFVADITSKADQATNQQKTARLQQNEKARAAIGLGGPIIGHTGDFGTDWLSVIFNPNQNTTDIIGIARYTEYAEAGRPLTKTMTSALFAKYGKPVRAVGNPSTELFFVWMDPHILRQTERSRTRCYMDGQTSLLFENDAINPGFALANRIGFASGTFVSKTNLIHNKNPYDDYSRCGIVAQADVKLVQGGDYVGSLNIRLVDLSKGYAELRQFGDDFWRDANAAREKKLNSDAANKPKL